MYVSCVSCGTGYAVRLLSLYNVTKTQAVDWFEQVPVQVASVRCVLIASDSCNTLRNELMSLWWANTLSKYIEGNVIYAPADHLL